MKRITAFSFLMIANFILLAHAVIPHHHHQSVACFEKIHCQNDSVAHEHKTAEHNHQHDGSSSNNCILKQAVIVLTNHNKNVTDPVFYSHNLSFDYHFTLTCSGNEAIIPILNINSLVPVYSFSYHPYISCSLSFRGPPLV